MPTLTLAQMQMYAASAGLNPPDLWAAIGMAESRGRTDVVNSIGCVGWLQINQPVHVKDHPNWTVTWLKDPAHNAQAAKIIFNAQGLDAWEAYTNGAYKQYYKNGNVTSANWTSDLGILANPLNPFNWWDAISGSGGNPLNAIPGVSEFTAVAKGVEAGFHWISVPYNWVRVGYVILGGALLALGTNLLVQSAALKFESSKVKAAIPTGLIGGKTKGA